MIKKDEWLRVQGPISNTRELIDRSNNGSLLGELGHPDRFETSLSNVSHVINNIRENNNNLYADIKILDTPYGDLLKNMINVGMPISFSQRAMGNVDSNGNITDYKVFSWDVIIDENYKLIELRRDKLKKILNRMNDEK
jgi:hypothetical protein